MDAEINNVIYMELTSGPKIANSTCGKTIDVETIDRDSTVYVLKLREHCYGNNILFYLICDLSYELVVADLLQVFHVLVVLH